MSSDVRARPQADPRPSPSYAQRPGPVEERATPRRDLAVTIGLFAALVSALLPVLPVVRPGGWMLGAIALAGLILAAGYLARRRRIPAVGVSLIEAALWVMFLTGVFLNTTAILWVIPTLDTFAAVPALVDRAVIEIANGSAPLDVSPSLSIMIVGAMGLLAIIVDHVVLTARMPLLASVGIIAVSLIPSIAVPGDLDVMAFVLLAASILFLIRAETSSRVPPLARAVERSAGVPATAIGIGAVAVIVALVATPLLPAPIPRTGAGVGNGPGIDASLQLGDDLRRPIEIEVMRVRTSGSDAPYLRATTLSRFDGAVWEPDRVRTVPLERNGDLGALEIDDDVRLVESTTTVDVVNLASIWAPIPYPAVSVTGLQGGWVAVPYNRTVVSQAGTAQGQQYEVDSVTPRPTLEQIRATTADSDEMREELTALPEDLPPIIAQLAAEKTAGAESDYDALIALQRWFRGSDFRYSLSAPVEEGFDGSGAEAVASFLEVKEGYCIHFASAFALMARSLGMPTRIVVGYLPGIPTAERIDDETVYSVPSSLLHAWPEVHFQGIGWVGFEPTNGLGSPTSFLPASVAPGQIGNPGETDPQPTASPSANPTGGPLDTEDPRAGETAGDAVRMVNPLPTLGAVLAILLLLGVPALVREVRRRQLATAAENGDSAAAWLTVQDAAIDVGIPVPAHESPRVFAARLVADHSAPASELGVLVRAIERASYASSAVAGYWHGNDVADAAAAVRAELMRTAPPARRVLAVIAPRSLIIRPGSVYAGGAGARVRAR
ncbi:transglutaminaseTgpA domain-containing protein [Microbacterium sp.]|uniref:transglutaminase family protein n=1 Tax=Microbacterium sp. TaxID=51671 RepID=UPI003F6EBFFB